MSSIARSRTIICCIILTFVMTALFAFNQYASADDPAGDDFINIGTVEGNLIPSGEFEASDASALVTSGNSGPARTWHMPESSAAFVSLEISDEKKYSGESSMAATVSATINLSYRWSTTTFKSDTQYMLNGYVYIPSGKTVTPIFFFASKKQVALPKIETTGQWVEIKHIVSYTKQEQTLTMTVDGQDYEVTEVPSFSEVVLILQMGGNGESTFYFDRFSFFEIYDATVEVKASNAPVTDLTADDFVVTDYAGNDVTDEVTIDLTQAAQGKYTFKDLTGPYTIKITYDESEKEISVNAAGSANTLLVEFGSIITLTVSVVDEEGETITSGVTITCKSSGSDVGVITPEEDGTFTIKVSDQITGIVLTAKAQGYKVNETSINVVEGVTEYTFTAEKINLVNIGTVPGNLIPCGEFEESDASSLVTSGNSGDLGTWHMPESSAAFVSLEISSEKKYSGESSMAATVKGDINLSYRWSITTLKADTQYVFNGYAYIPTGKSLQVIFFLQSGKMVSLPSITTTEEWVEFNYLVSYTWYEQNVIVTVDGEDYTFENVSMSHIVVILGLRGSSGEATFYFDRLSMFEIFDAEVEVKTYSDPVTDLTTDDFTLTDFMGNDITADIEVDLSNAEQGKYKFKGLTGQVTLKVNNGEDEEEVEFTAAAPSQAVDFGTYFSITVKVVDDKNKVITQGVTITCKANGVNIGEIKYNYNGTVTISKLYGTGIVLSASVNGYTVNEASINVVDGTDQYTFTAVKLPDQSDEDGDEEGSDGCSGCDSALGMAAMGISVLMLGAALLVARSRKQK